MHYLLLAIAIVGEVVATTSLKFSEGYTKLLPSVVSISAYIICYYAFSKSVLKLNLGVAYATWCAVGLIVTALISVYLFKEHITPIGIAALLMITVGTIILNLYGTVH